MNLKKNREALKDLATEFINIKEEVIEMLTLEDCKDFLRIIRSVRTDLKDNKANMGVADFQLELLENRLEDNIDDFLNSKLEWEMKR